MKKKSMLSITALMVVLISLIIVWASGYFSANITEEQLSVTSGDIKRGAYLARSSGCIACHSNTSNGGKPLAGGAGLETPFGTFYAPNLTSNKDHGIGNWTLQQFSTALRQGVSPQGKPYYPAFPYSFYTKLSDQDVADLWAAFQTVPGVAKASTSHQLNFPFNLREGLNLWQRLFFNRGRFESTKPLDLQYARGEYLVESVTHCAACHTPRNLLGALDQDNKYAGSESLLAGEGKIPAISSDLLLKAGWDIKSLSYALKSGIKPDGDVFGSSMGEVVRDGTAYMKKEDLTAIAYYLFNRE